MQFENNSLFYRSSVAEEVMVDFLATLERCREIVPYNPDAVRPYVSLSTAYCAYSLRFAEHCTAPVIKNKGFHKKLSKIKKMLELSGAV